ncbi:sorbosone dehydrogenase family protein [Maribacter confluentis]|uniref:Sorbosone dehydrogenase family protein n=1 Tax=Maribacter confluentis TaxID=1656093 RepID=A0ABT8RWA2_9FLAO|nr:sorbosone dehydrogenase family protein [Maribacter confluentis]MDO1511064.1 sorbosone dehydrogenase family protein [Maribacter confluentis]MDO1514767.1 sorbosone dehydrogenase family protein [Maribacter confluentis]
MTTKIYNIISLAILVIAFSSCKDKKQKEATEVANEVVMDSTDLALLELNLPEGFNIEVYARGIDGARSMAMGDNGTLFVGTRNENTVYAIQDNDGDFKADNVIILDTMEVPNGIAIRNGDLYVAQVGSLWKYPSIEDQLGKSVEKELVYDDFPTEFHHGWKYIAFGPDDKLYVPVGAPCNICNRTNEDERFATISRMDPDGSNREIYARGVRNSVGFTWHPETKEMWFTDNGRDMLGDDIPPCELNKVTEAGQHFGYPFCHGGIVKDPEFGDEHPCSDFVSPALQLGAHVAPLGIKFYTGTMFPQEYKGRAFIAEHGSWNRSKKVGYRIMMVDIEEGEVIGNEVFIDGWLDEVEQKASGRPVDMLMLKDGSMLISDDFGDAIYRVTYSETALAQK